MLALGLGLGLTMMQSGQGGEPAPAPSFVTAAEVIGDLNAAITPTNGISSVLMPTDGWVLRLTTNLGPITTVDATKIVLSTLDKGWNPDGSANASVGRTITGTAAIRKPYPSGAAFTWADLPEGVVEIALDQRLYRPGGVTSDGTRIVLITLAEGAVNGSSPAAVFSGSLVERSDSHDYPIPIWKQVDHPKRRIAGSLTYEWAVTDEFARNGQQVACIEAWIRDKNGVDGAIARAGSMSESVHTGVATPSGLSAPVYATAVNSAGLADGVAEVRSICRPWIGPARESVVVGDDWSTTPTPNLLKGVPCLIDTAGAYSEVYAWVNQTGVAGASPAVQTGAGDPGSTSGYANYNTAKAALLAYNTARGHADLSGGVIMMRDVAGSTAGQDAGSYAVRANFNGGTVGPLPLVIRAASGAVSELCRLRSRLPDGTVVTGPTGKQIFAQIVWEHIYFDGENTDAGANTSSIIDGGNNGNSSTALTTATMVMQVFKGCREVNHSTSVSSLLNTGFKYCYRHEEVNTRTSGAAFTNFAGVVIAAGSKMGPMAHTTLLGAWVIPTPGNSIPIASQAANANTPPIRGPLFIHSRIDYQSSGNAAISILENEARTPQNDLGIGICGLLIRRYGAASGPALRIGADSSFRAYRNVVVQHLAVTYGAASESARTLGRINWHYNDWGYVQVVKEASARFCALTCPNNKDGYYNAPEKPSDAGAAVAWAANTAYRLGTVAHDGNATTAARLVYQAIRDVPNTGVALTDANYWFVAGTTWSTAFGPQPLRAGNKAFRLGVGCLGNIGGADAQNHSSPGYNNEWLGEIAPPGSEWGTANPADFWVDDSGGAAATISTLGDYRPNPTGPLVNRVPAGFAVTPFDPLGTPRDNDGAGAAGWLEAA
jgi:hypothetical protein